MCLELTLIVKEVALKSAVDQGCHFLYIFPDLPFTRHLAKMSIFRTISRINNHDESVDLKVSCCLGLPFDNWIFFLRTTPTDQPMMLDKKREKWIQGPDLPFALTLPCAAPLDRKSDRLRICIYPENWNSRSNIEIIIEFLTIWCNFFVKFYFQNGFDRRFVEQWNRQSRRLHCRLENVFLDSSSVPGFGSSALGNDMFILQGEISNMSVEIQWNED